MHPEIIEVSLDDLEKQIPKVIHRVLDAKHPLNNAILVITNGLERFDDFWAVCSALEENLEQSGLIDAIQLAHFHPTYRFSELSNMIERTGQIALPFLHYTSYALQPWKTASRGFPTLQQSPPETYDIFV